MSRLTEEEYHRLSALIRERLGIVYGQEKKDVLAARVQKVMNLHGIAERQEFLTRIFNLYEQALWQDFINAVTINTTHFFRESAHFEFIAGHAAKIRANNPNLAVSRELRAWSAACSSGEEPYTLAMVLQEAFGQSHEIKLLATDIDSKVIHWAQQALYNADALHELPDYYRRRYFYQWDSQYGVAQDIKDLVTFRLFNLMEDFPFKKNFDLIFCRNVLIYYDRTTQNRLLHKIHKALNPGGLLFTGHSEPLTDKSLGFTFIKPAIYQKQ